MKAVLFDMDDTLLRTIEARWACHKAVAKKFWDIDLTDADIAKHWGVPMSVLVDRIYDPSDTHENRVNAYLSMADAYPKLPYEGAVDVVVGLLDAGIEVGVVTSARKAVAVSDMQLAGFPVERFCIFQGEETHAAHKPDPAVFDPAFQVLSSKGIERFEIAYVGDSLFDAGAAVDAGLTFVGVTTGLPTAHELTEAGASIVISSITELPDALAGVSA